MTTPSQADQLAESANRAALLASQTGSNETDAPQTRINDNTEGTDLEGGQPRTARVPAEDDAGEQPRGPRMSPADEARANIAKRFKRNADGEEDVPFNGDANDPEMRYGKVARAPAEQPDPNGPDLGVRAQDMAPAPAKRTLTVRGQKVEMTEDEILAAASKTLAADSYLEESRQILESAKEIRRSRAGLDPQHPEGQNEGTQTNGQDQDQLEEPRRPGDRLKSAVDKILYGDPDEAAAELGEAIDEAADQKAEKRQLMRLVGNDLAATQRAVKAFEDRNPELAKDENAVILISQTVDRILREDLAKLGTVDADKLPKDAKALADWHRLERVHGRPVMKPEEALEEAKRRYIAWRGPAASTKQQAPSKTAPAVEVDRTARRQALPNQPTRTVAPRRDAQQQAPRTQSRPDVIAKMRQARGQTV